MEDLQTILISIEKKVNQLALEKIDLEELLLNKNREIDQLKQEIIRLKEENRDKRENNIINNNSDLTEYRFVIEDLLKKIDKSISILLTKEKEDNV